MIVKQKKETHVSFLELVKANLGVFRGNAEVKLAIRSLAKLEDREVRVFAEGVASFLQQQNTLPFK